jgi:hypothetical protein
MKSTQERTAQECNEMIAQAVPHIVGRFLDPKNVKKGTHINTPALQMYRWIQKEGLEAHQAYRNEEGWEREIEECCDGILLNIMRIDQILKEQS